MRKKLPRVSGGFFRVSRGLMRPAGCTPYRIRTRFYLRKHSWDAHPSLTPAPSKMHVAAPGQETCHYLHKEHYKYKNITISSFPSMWGNEPWLSSGMLPGNDCVPEGVGSDSGRT